MSSQTCGTSPEGTRSIRLDGRAPESVRVAAGREVDRELDALDLEVRHLDCGCPVLGPFDRLVVRFGPDLNERVALYDRQIAFHRGGVDDPAERVCCCFLVDGL